MALNHDILFASELALNIMVPPWRPKCVMENENVLNASFAEELAKLVLLRLDGVKFLIAIES